jgi:tetratricopeptide (TPR) repeat protein
MFTRRAALLALCLATAAGAAGPSVEGEYDSPLGRIRLESKGDAFVGRLVAPSRACPFHAGDEVLRATLLDDSLAGQLRVCLTGPSCPESAWGNAVLLVTADGLSGAVHAASGCQAPVGKSGGLAFTRVAVARPGRSPAVPATPASARRAKARELLRDGAAYLDEGSFERARARFLQAIEVDATIPEAYNGVGVTYRMRNDLPAALGWYKKALAVDPDFGDAYYNMACVYALQGEKELALRYLQIAALNGYASAEGIDADPDLASLHDEAAYRALVRARL